ncbi:predicted protein [Histoplasma capsulatum var. duboisii H88]|uniref:Predicted protein n=2 Tax=Ajellomyces capsulatus TaxID=5037 RepID=F0UJX3_AJEC8|nr:predicted protein [Histoplasma capsulatum H143]EGC46661.1 predicted protein [Histoplasma capsulatum var. duboisii H88]
MTPLAEERKVALTSPFLARTVQPRCSLWSYYASYFGVDVVWCGVVYSVMDRRVGYLCSFETSTPSPTTGSVTSCAGCQHETTPFNVQKLAHLTPPNRSNRQPCALHAPLPCTHKDTQRDVCGANNI